MDELKKFRMVKEAIGALEQATHVMTSTSASELEHHEIQSAALSAQKATAVLFTLLGSMK